MEGTHQPFDEKHVTKGLGYDEIEELTDSACEDRHSVCFYHPDQYVDEAKLPERRRCEICYSYLCISCLFSKSKFLDRANLSYVPLPKGGFIAENRDIFTVQTVCAHCFLKEHSRPNKHARKERKDEQRGRARSHSDELRRAQRIINEWKQLPRGWYDKGNTHLRMEQYEEAITYYNKITRIEKTYPAGVNKVG